VTARPDYTPGKLAAVPEDELRAIVAHPSPRAIALLAERYGVHVVACTIQAARKRLGVPPPPHPSVRAREPGPMALTDLELWSATADALAARLAVSPGAIRHERERRIRAGVKPPCRPEQRYVGSTGRTRSAQGMRYESEPEPEPVRVTTDHLRERGLAFDPARLDVGPDARWEARFLGAGQYVAGEFYPRRRDPR